METTNPNTNNKRKLIVENKKEATNKKVRPFYIDCRGLSKEQVIDILLKSVKAGADLCEFCYGAEDFFRDVVFDYAFGVVGSKFWGVSESNKTYTYDYHHCFGDEAIEIQYADLDKHLCLQSEITQPKEGVVDNLNETIKRLSEISNELGTSVVIDCVGGEPVIKMCVPFPDTSGEVVILGGNILDKLEEFMRVTNG